MFVGRLNRAWLLRSPDDGAGSGGGDVAGAGEGSTGDSSATGEAGGEASGSGDDGAGDEPTYEQLSTQAKELSDKAEALRVSKLTDEERAAEEAAKAADAVPEEYADFTMPKNMPADEQLLKDFKPVAKELGLSQTEAQKLIDLYGERVAPLMAQRQQEAWQGQLDSWVKEIKSDKEIGGDKFDAAVSDAQRVINTIGTPELKQAFEQFGLGNHPELVRVFSRMAKYLSEDNIVTGGTTNQNKNPGNAFWPTLPR